MHKPTIRLSTLRLVISLLIIPCTIVLYVGVSAGQMNPDSEQNNVNTPIERFTDFTDGIVEHIGKGMITLRGTEYIFSEETKFTSMTEDIHTDHDIQPGDFVRIIFAPIENNIIMEIELQEKAVDQEKHTFQSNRATNSKTDVITFENGMYSN